MRSGGGEPLNCSYTDILSSKTPFYIARRALKIDRVMFHGKHGLNMRR